MKAHQSQKPIPPIKLSHGGGGEVAEYRAMPNCIRTIPNTINPQPSFRCMPRILTAEPGGRTYPTRLMQAGAVIAASVVPLLLGAAVGISCFHWVFSKPPAT